MEDTYRLTGRTTRMIAAAYARALETPAAVQVLLVSAAEVNRWTAELHKLGPIPQNLLLTAIESRTRYFSPENTFIDPSRLWQQAMRHNLQPWQMTFQSFWEEYRRYNLENTPVELKRLERTDAKGATVHPSVSDLVMQMRVSAGHSDGCDSEEHY